MSEEEELEASRMPLLDHLRELRDRMVRATVGLAAGMAVALFFVQDLIVELRRPFDEGCVEAERQLREAGYLQDGAPFVCELGIVDSPFEAVYTWLWTSFLAGVVLAMPVMAYQAWQFVAPGLLRSERRMVYPLTLGSSVLFVAGAAFCFYVLLPFAMPFFFTVIPNLATNLSIRGYLSGITTMMLAFGLCFQLPVVVYFFARLGLIDHRDLIVGFRYAVVGIFVVAALITPPDPLTQTALALPLLALYGVGIGVAFLVSTKEREGASA